MSAYHQTLDFLYRLEVERMDLKLERVAEALHRCDSPHLRFPSLHIAGTNGKGSTAAMLYAMLSAAGYHVGLFTSPHLVDFCERIRLGARCISEEEVVEGVAAIRAQIESTTLRLTPFEMMTLLAFRAFAQAQVDIAVVEVGLGGRLDATNVLAPVASAITGIGLDHQAYLGHTIVDIAYEKGGIIKPGVPVIIGRVDPESRALLCGLARDRTSPASLYDRDFTMRDGSDARKEYHGRHWRVADIRLGVRGRFQCDNAAVALATVEAIRDTFPVTVADVRHGLQGVRWPGRLDIVSRSPLVILDGAHNPQAMQTLVDELPAVVEGKRVKLLFAVMRDKDWQAMIPLLASLASEVVVTRVQQPRAEDPFALQAAFAPVCPVRVIPDARAACRQLVSETGPDEVTVVCGSLFLVGEVYPFFASPCAPLFQPDARGAP